MSNIVLYYFEACPYCIRVVDFMARMKIDIPKKDIRVNKAFRDELIGVGGKSQVPCLVIDGKPLYESEDIIEWMEDNLLSAEAKEQPKIEASGAGVLGRIKNFFNGRRS